MQLDEKLDEVKGMNKHMMFGRVAAVRDKQVIENIQLEKEYADEQARIQKMLEITRVRGIIEEEERANEVAARKKQGQQYLIEQIQDRNYRRAQEAEERERERMAVLAKVKKLTEEDEKKTRDKQQAARDLLEDFKDQVATANALKQ